jgi:hypothetical protein
MDDCKLSYITKLKPSILSQRRKKRNCIESWKTNNNSWNYNIDEDYTRLNHGEHSWPTYVHKYLSISIVIVKYCAKHQWTIEIYNKENKFQLMQISKACCWNHVWNFLHDHCRPTCCNELMKFDLAFKFYHATLKVVQGNFKFLTILQAMVQSSRHSKLHISYN